MTTALDKTTKDILEVAHITLEYKMGVGGIKYVTTGLVPALARQGIVNPSVITPYYDVYDGCYKHLDLKSVATVTHIYKGQPFKSDIFRVCTDIVNEKPIYHYLIKPAKNSPVAWLFNIGDEKNIYQSFKHSEAQNRLQYFNGAVAAMLRMPNENIPEFDIVHCHTWHTGLAACLAKEFANLPAYRDLITADPRPLKKIPHVISTVHMLLKGEHGTLTSPQSVKNLLTSIGLPENFAQQFPQHSKNISAQSLQQIFLALLYADCVTTVSKGLVTEVLNGKSEELDGLFKLLNYNQRLHGITNGIKVSDWEATNPNNLQEFVFNPSTISADKLRLKKHLCEKYPNLDPQKKWFIFIGRFANEKGVDYLGDLLATVKKVNGNLIVLGAHVVTTLNEHGQKIPRYRAEIDALKADSRVVVIDDIKEQKIIGKKFRAAADCGVNLSKNEACGLVPMELMTCGVISVVPNIQGLPDTIKPLSQNLDTGTGILYDGDPAQRTQNLATAISAAAKFLDTKKQDGTLDAFLSKLMANAKQYDWDANAAKEYNKLYKNLVQRELLTYDKIRKNNDGKIWQIGFNKAGSTTLFKFFLKNKIPSAHYGIKGQLATSMQENFKHNKPLLSPEYEKYTAFFDMENIYADPPVYISQTLFKELDTQYPGSKFILNTRNKESWIKSRCAHVDPTNQRSYLDVLCEKYQTTTQDLVARWSQEFDDHHAAVLEHFKDRPDDLLVFDIDKDQPEKICEFFAGEFDLDPSLYSHENKSITTGAVAKRPRP